MRDGNGETVWNKKLLGLIGASLGIVLVVSTSFLTHELDLTKSQTEQNDKIADHERRIERLEAIAATNSEARVRVEEQLKIIRQQHDDMMNDLSRIEDLLQKHERESRRRNLP